MKMFHFILKSTAIATALSTMMAMTPLGFAQKQARVSANPLAESSDLPLSLTLGELDGSWRKFKTSGQYEFGDLMKAWANLIGFSSYNNLYFTQGKTITVAGNSYLVAYRFPVSDEDINLEEMFDSWQLGEGCDPSEMTDSMISLDTKVSLSLLNPNTIGSLNDIESFDVTTEIEKAKAQQEARQLLCEKAEAESKMFEAQQYLRTINYAQQDLYLETGTLTGNLAGLNAGMPSGSDDYYYSVTLQSPDFMTSQAIAKSPEGFNLVGAVAAVSSGEEKYTISILCQSEEAGTTVPTNPILNSSIPSLSCAPGTKESY
ncbi:MAG: hypothetical protein HC799_17330 [Limnothrix sp. RL_2_0]|nr:hypothetical protein [Limnothrix sp. RL_2_0]